MCKGQGQEILGCPYPASSFSPPLPPAGGLFEEAKGNGERGGGGLLGLETLTKACAEQAASRTAPGAGKRVSS